MESGRRILESAGPRNLLETRERGVYTSVVPVIPLRYGIPKSARASRNLIGPCLVALTASSLIAAQADPGDNYIDARICSGCHTQIARDYL